MNELPINQIVCADTLTTLKTFPSESIDCVITSPPYYGLRDYGIKGQIGLEKTPEEYIAKMTKIFKQIFRVMKKTGTFWLNIGDTYGGSRESRSNVGVRKKHIKEGDIKINPQAKMKPKCLLMMPERLAFACLQVGFTLRNKIVWFKPNAMPSSVKDRFSNCWEYIYFFSKARKYWFDLDAVRKPHKTGKGAKFNLRVRDVKRGYASKSGQYKASEKEVEQYHGQQVIYSPLGKNPGDVFAAKHHGSTLGGQNRQFREVLSSQSGRNPGDFWRIPTQPFPQAHFAVFPEKLCETPIKAGCPKEGIVLDPFCGAGTALIVAKKLGRNFIGIDIKQEYCDMALKRLEKVPIRLDKILVNNTGGNVE